MIGFLCQIFRELITGGWIIFIPPVMGIWTARKIFRICHKDPDYAFLLYPITIFIWFMVAGYIACRLGY